MDNQDIGAIAGFIAGEGHIGVTKNYQWKPYIHPRFTIQVHKRDREVLEQIRDTLGVGKVKDRSNRPHSTLVIKSKDGLSQVVEILSKCNSNIWLSSDKYENYQTWREIVDIHLGEEATTTEERLQMSEMAKDLNKEAGHNNVDWDEFQRRLREYENG